MICAVIPTLFRPPTLAPLLEVLAHDGVDVILIETKGRDLAIYEWWNEGVAEARRRGATEIAVLNDDIAMSPGTLPALADALRQDSTLGVAYPENSAKTNCRPTGVVQCTEGIWRRPKQPGMTGYAFMIPASLPVKFNEAYHWYCGDNAFEEDVRAAGYGVGCVRGVSITHIGDHSGQQRRAELADLIREDRQRWAGGELWAEKALEQAYAAAMPAAGEMTALRIPAILHRIAIGPVPEDAKRFWEKFAVLHPAWELRSHADPFDPLEWPLTSWAWPFVTHPAQQADLMRLEALWRDGGIYVDWDIEPYRPFGNLLALECFAAWAEPTKVANGVMGARPGHPAIAEALDAALQRFVLNRKNIMASGPNAVTDTFRGRSDVLLLSPESFYSQPLSKRGEAMPDFSDRPWAYGIHHMHASWAPRAPRAGVSGRWKRKETKLW